MALLITSFLSAFFLIGTFFLIALNSSLRRSQKKTSKKLLDSKIRFFFYRPLHHFFFPSHEYQGLLFITVFAANMARFGFAVCATIFFMNTDLYASAIQAGPLTYMAKVWTAFIVFALIGTSFVVGDYLPRLFGARYPVAAMKASAPIASFFMVLSFPFSFLFLKISRSLAHTVYLNHLYEPITEAKQELIEIIQQADLSPSLEAHEKKLLYSVLAFKDRIAREVMVPRVDVFSLPAEISIKEAAEKLESEGYSRIPVYKNTVDSVTGVLMYKDILSKYREYELKGNDPKILEAPLETIQKSVLHIPETKKLSSLLQEFRKKQVHLAIVVDEYGGTEGIVTIEDILEQIVGDIADEYDQAEELYQKHPDGGWIVDARLNIWDAKEELGIEIPEEGDYDTIGGYIFHITGTIPLKGFVIHQENFDMEITESNDRCVELVRIKPLSEKK